MTRIFKNLMANQSGAVTVDWIVLTAAIAGLGIAVLASVSEETHRMAADTQTYLIDLQPEG